MRSIPLLAVLIGTPSLARGDGGAAALAEAGKVVKTVEIIIPDLRFERSFTAADNRLALSVPLAVRAGHVDIGTSSGLLFIHMAEAQFEVTREEFRGLLGERMLFHGSGGGGFMPFLEVGGVLGTDGSGAMVGGGIAYGDGKLGMSVGIVTRFVITNEERRGDIALDVQFPLNIAI